MQPVTKHEEPEDALRDAMDRVRGVRPVKRHTSPSEPNNVVEFTPSPRVPLRSRVSRQFARVQAPNAALWPRSVAGIVAGIWAAAMSWLAFTIVLIGGWVFAPLGSGELGDVLRASSGTWVLAQGGALHWQHAVLSLAPLGATLVVLLFQRRAGAWLADAIDSVSIRDMAQSLGFAVAASATVELLVVTAASNGSLKAPFLHNIAGSALVSMIGFGWGAVRVHGLQPSTESAAVLAVCRKYFAAIFAVSAVAVIVQFVLERKAFFAVLDAIAGDTTSKLQAIALCIGYLPTLLGWSAALLTGPGFTVGAGTAVSLSNVTLGALPPIPLFAAIPTHVPAHAQWAMIVIAAIAVASVWKAALNARLVVLTLGATFVSSALIAISVIGGIGPGRLTMVGPVWWQFTIAVTGWLLLGFAVRWGFHAVRGRIANAQVSTGGDEVAQGADA